MKFSKFHKIVILLVLALCFAQNAYAQSATALKVQNEIRVLIDGWPVASEVNPIIKNDRVMLPFRVLAEALNVTVSWEGSTQTVRAQAANTEVQLKIGDKTAYWNGEPVSLDAAPLIIDGRTLIPARFFSETFGCKVEWLDSVRTVKIYSQPRAMSIYGFYALGDSSTSSWTNLFGKAYPETGTGNTDIISELGLGWYSLDSDGSLLTKSSTGWQRPDSWEQLLVAAEEYKIATEMVVHVTDRDGLLVKMLSNPKSAGRAVRDIVGEAKLYQGVNLDFEGLGWGEQGEQLKATQQSFSHFVGLLYKQLEKEGLSLTLTLHPPNGAYHGYDYAALAKLCDRIIVMAYDYGEKPEPLGQVTQAVEMALASVPREKLLLGISAPSETPESILGKAGIAKKYNLGGIALWRLGLVSEDMFDTLRLTVKKN